MPRYQPTSVEFGEQLTENEKKELKKKMKEREKEAKAKAKAKAKEETKKETKKEETKKRKREGKQHAEDDKVNSTLPTESPKPGDSGYVPPSPTKNGRPTGKGTGRTTTTSELNKIYYEHLDELLDALYALEYHADVGLPCSCGRTDEEIAEGRDVDAGTRVWRCVECTDQRPSCGICLRERHLSAPFHKVQRWNGAFFDRGSLKDVDLRLWLGHPDGRCPSAPDDDRGTLFTIGDVSGIHEIYVHACHCHGYGESTLPLVAQLVAARLWPATFRSPRTAYTFSLMEHWHLDVMQGKKPVYDYWLSLQRRTKMVAKDLKDYKTFLRSGREYRDVMLRKRSGQPLGIDDFLPTNRYKGSVALVCVACPEPGFNMPDDWKVKVLDPDERCKYVKILGFDGSYKANLKIKRHDPDDRSLNDGKAYFIPWDDFLAYEERFKEDTAPSGPCPGIDAMHRIVGGRNTELSGVVALVCVRHSHFCPQGLVNLRVKEKFSILDLCIRYGLGPFPDPDLPLILVSDRACQFLLYIAQRWAEEFPDDPILLDLIRRVVWAIPKMHVYGHGEDCQYWLHFLYLVDSGRTCGEGVERPWPETNATGMITKDASPGHREDVLNDTHGDWNMKKMLGMSQHLSVKAKEAATNVVRAKKDLDDYAAKIPKKTLDAWWEQYPSEAGMRDEKGHVTSRYRADTRKLAKREQLMEMIAAEELKQGGKYARGKGPMALLRRLIDLELDQLKLRQKVKDARNDPSARDAIDKARQALRVQIKLVRPLQKKHMPELQDLLSAEEETSENVEEEDAPEEDPLYLPSSFSAAQREEFLLTKLGEKELKMREHYAETELDLLKLAIRLYLTNVSTKRTQVSGQAAQTRANAKLKNDSQRRAKYIKRYTLHYDSMLALGYDKDAVQFRPIDEKLADEVKDVTRPEPLGNGKKSDAWFWREGEGKDVTKIRKKSQKELAQMNEEEKHVRYFRLWAAWKRWDEEWKILGAEFDRTVKSFDQYSKIWTKLATRSAEISTVARGDMEKRIARLEELDVPRAKQGPSIQHLRRIAIAEGRRAYSHKKASFFEGLQREAIIARQEAGEFDNGRSWDGWQVYNKEHEHDTENEARKKRARR